MIFEDINEFNKNLIKNKRLIAFDVGSKKIGIAISDLTRTISNPSTVITRKNLKKDCILISKILNEDFCGIVIGFPILMNGKKGDACREIEKFANLIIKYFNLPIYLQDERLSTRAALKILDESNYSRQKKNNIDDKISASYILQTVLDLIRYNSNTNVKKY